MLYFRHFGSVDWANLAVGLCSILLIVLTPRFSRRIPGSLVAIVVLTAGVWALRTYAGMEGVDTIGDRFTIRAELPAAAMPAMDWEVMRSLFPVALNHCAAGGYRIPAFGDGRRRCDRRPPRFEYRAYGAGCRQPAHSAVRRHSGPRVPSPGR